MMADSGMMDDIEARRLAKLARFDILDTPSEREFDTLTWLAQRLLGCSISAVSLVDDHRQWFKAQVGLTVNETPRSMSFCAHAMHHDEIMVIEDAHADPRFATNPLVTGDPKIRFYAGVPLRPSLAGEQDALPGIGAFCIADSRPRALTESEQAILRDLAAMVTTLIEARASADAAKKLVKLLEDRANEVDRKNRQLGQAERLAGIGSWRFDLATQALEWSDQVFAIHGLPVGAPPVLEAAMAAYPERDQPRVAEFIRRASEEGEPFDFESDFVRADGAVRRVRSVGEAECAGGAPVALIGVFQDVTERHAQMETLRRSASTDSLTGLPNRAAFELRLAECIHAARREGTPLALLLIDLDGFKQVNDSFGHEAGDDVLRAMAARLRESLPQHGFAARLGGDEFVMMLSRPRDCAALETVVERVVRAMTHCVERDGEARAVSATIGAARWDMAYSASDIVRLADLALYQAKRHRRGTGRIYSPADEARPLAAA